MDYALSHAYQASIFNIGCPEVVGLILSVIVVGVIVYFAAQILAFAKFIDDQFKAFALWLIRIVGIIYIVVACIQVVFGINLLGINAPLVC